MGEQGARGRDDVLATIAPRAAAKEHFIDGEAPVVHGVPSLGAPFVGIVKAIVDILRHVAVHVVQAEAIGLQQTREVCSALGIVLVPSVVMQFSLMRPE